MTVESSHSLSLSFRHVHTLYKHECKMICRPQIEGPTRGHGIFGVSWCQVSLKWRQGKLYWKLLQYKVLTLPLLSGTSGAGVEVGNIL